MPSGGGTMQDETGMIKESAIDIPYNWTTGKAMGRFLTDFRDSAKIGASRCSGCGRVYVPPQDFCDLCFTEMRDWVDLPGTGTVESYTVVHVPNPGQPNHPPYAIGLIRLDGADSCLLHLLGGAPPEHRWCGARVKPRWRAERRGEILDIEHFEPV